MDAVKYFEEKERMCKAIKRKCNKCELQHIDFDQHCAVISQRNPKEAVKIVEKWSVENPRKTILQDFLEKYPNAVMYDGRPSGVCPIALGFEENEEKPCWGAITNCRDCWNRPLEG